MVRVVRNLLCVAVALVGLGLLGLAIVHWSHAAEGPRKVAAAQGQNGDGERNRGGVQVEVEKPRAGGLKRVTSQPGSVHAFAAANLYSKVSGYLKEQPVDIGDHVKEGQVLAVIDAPELEKEVDRAAANVERTKAVVTQMQAHVATSRADYEAAKANVTQAENAINREVSRLSYHQKQFVRFQELLNLKSIDARLVDEKEDQYLSAQSALDVSKAAVVTAQAQATAAAAKIDQAKADVKDAEAEVQVAIAAHAKASVLFQYTKIVSPYDGVITLRSFHRGDFIRLADDDKIPLLRVEQTDLMRIVVQVPDRDVPYIKVGNPATMEIDALPGVPFVGKVARFANSEDHTTRTMRTEIDIPNPDDQLRDGMYGGVTIELQNLVGNATVTLPSTAIVGKSQGGKGQVYVVRDGTVHLVTVQVGQDNGVEVEILKGLTPQESVVVRYNGSISDGLKAIVSDVKRPSSSKNNQ